MHTSVVFPLLTSRDKLSRRRNRMEPQSCRCPATFLKGEVVARGQSLSNQLPPCFPLTDETNE